MTLQICFIYLKKYLIVKVFQETFMLIKQQYHLFWDSGVELEIWSMKNSTIKSWTKEWSVIGFSYISTKTDTPIINKKLCFTKD